MIQYKEVTEGQSFIVRTNEDGSESWIPKDESNSDYQAYLNKDTLVTESAPTA